jgi:hypothetical protein
MRFIVLKNLLIPWYATLVTSVMGRVCPAPCEDGCNRNEVEDTVGINAVEQFIGDTAKEEGYKFEFEAKDTGNRRFLHATNNIQPTTNIVTRGTRALARWCLAYISWTFMRFIVLKNLLIPWYATLVITLIFKHSKCVVVAFIILSIWVFLHIKSPYLFCSFFFY